MHSELSVASHSDIEVVELIKKLVADNFLDSRLKNALIATLAKNSSAFCHSLNGEYVFVALARHCVKNNQTDAIILLSKAFHRHRQLAHFTSTLKNFLLSDLRNGTSIAGLFQLHLSDPDVSRICRMVKSRKMKLGNWASLGLQHINWIELCEAYIDGGHSFDEMDEEAKSKIQDAITEMKGESTISKSSVSINLSIDFETISVGQLKYLQSHLSLPNIRPNDWHKILTHPELPIRSMAVELIGTYMASGRHQEHTLKMLLESRSHLSRETYLRAITVSCIALSRVCDRKTARFAESGVSQRQHPVLPLTQDALSSLTPKESCQDFVSSERDTWSYLSCFQGQCLLYLSLFDALREQESIASFAAHQFKVISHSLGKTCWQLCQPYWPWLAPKIVRHYNPKYVDWFCTTVLRVSQQDFLLRTSNVIIPHLCHAGKKQIELCEQIASYRGCSLRRLYIHNAAAIIALLLMSSSNDVEVAWTFSEEKFMSLDRSFRSLKFSQILASWRVDAIYEVLMLTTDKNAALAIGMVNKIMECAYSQNEGEQRELLQQTVFKLVVKFSEIMRNLMGRQSQSTKLSALIGLRILIERFLPADLVSSVLRQLTAFLQAALENKLLSLAALKAWMAVINKLEISKMEVIVDLTYAIITEKIDSWDRDTVKCAMDIVRTIDKLLKEKGPPKKIHFQSLSGLMPSSEAEGDINNDFVEHAAYDILQSLVSRDTENTYLARQTARDICAFGLQYQDDILSWARSDGPGHDLLGQTIRVLLTLCAKNDLDLKRHSVRALGLLGALDPHKTIIASKNTGLVMISNFQNVNEVIAFSRVLVQDWFLPAFEAAIDPAVQRYFAYGIQELLKFMGIENEIKLKILFKDESLVSTLLPLVKTKYTTDMKHWNAPSYPIFMPMKPYSEWLIYFCSDMMSRTTDSEYGAKIFTWCWKVLYGSSTGPEMWAFLLPYAALAAVIDRLESKTNREVFISEVLLVLDTSGDNMQPFHECLFAVIDYFNQWMRSRRQAKLALLNMDTLLAEIPARLMAQRALESGAFPRAIRYFEQQIREDSSSESQVLQNLRQIYANIQDVDSLEGITTRIPSLSVKEQILGYRATSQWDAALACYNALPVSEYTLSTALECLHRSGRERDVLAELSNDDVSSAVVATESAWCIQDWDALAKWSALIEIEKGNNFQVPAESTQALGFALLHLHNQNFEQFRNSLELGRKFVGMKLGELMSSQPITSLRQIREMMIYLHGLADVESLGALVMPESLSKEALAKKSTKEMVSDQLNARLSVLSPLNEGPEFEAKRFLLTLRGAALSCVRQKFSQATQLMAETHIKISEAARNHGQSLMALTEIASAKHLGGEMTEVAHAHLLWSQGQSRAAIRLLQSQIPPDFFEKPKSYPEVAPYALDWTSWRDAAAQVDTKVIIDNYSAVIKALPRSAEAQYRLAKHYVKIFDETTQDNKADGRLHKAIVSHFGKALELGTSRASEALPKMLTTWFDLGVYPKDLTPQASSSRKHSLTQVNKEIQNWGKAIDIKLVYTCIPQLLSRLNHPSKAIKNLIGQLIILVLQSYPHHTLWPVLEKGQATQNLLQEAASKIVKSKQNEFSSLVTSSSDLVEKLKRLCAQKPKAKEMKLADFGEDFVSCLQNPSLAVPVQANMDGLENILIYQIEERVIVQQSLQRPKRIVIWGTDGKQYQLLLKGNDDVRKDARLIEFTTAVNQLLRADPAATSRHLDILTYRVTPLGASAGIIEWVKGAVPARTIMYSLSRNQNLGLGSNEVKKMTNTSLRLSERLNAFYKLQKAVPPVLWEWFVDTFPDPEAWLDARTRYARTLAVMSMIGYILGLGDRHLENILLVQGSGAVLHVDFDCLFDKGRHLAVPELVPFRLTQQFRDALGVLNNEEGHFRRVSELTLKIVRCNEDLLMVILEAFIHDPVVQDRISLLQPWETMSKLRAKIRGIREPNSVLLSVSGLVDELIEEAISSSNLCQLFKGWMPWV